MYGLDVSIEAKCADPRLLGNLTLEVESSAVLIYQKSGRGPFLKEDNRRI
jgi:hypothetical protein